MLSRLLLVKVEIIGQLVGDAGLTESFCLCAVSMRSEFSPPGRECRLLCLGFGALGARSRPGCHPTVAAAPSSTVCGERHGAREIHRRTTKIIQDGDVVGVELCGENGHPGSRVRPSASGDLDERGRISTAPSLGGPQLTSLTQLPALRIAGESQLALPASSDRRQCPPNTEI